MHTNPLEQAALDLAARLLARKARGLAGVPGRWRRWLPWLRRH
ncbi:hypothetical protein CURE108131_04785 [Cupriavidus respiraculi]|uniref:Uncharacterized protein n=1 Tax=Cupriavidus respiraculi TaxID=195930 RepID=A0ABM8WKN8_9BURK|nr:hypothetical protein [Cupriavidus respiraculi]CAG9167712.1 hypothetical protein LMG21510_00829 [Cupriavidus respiraculi]